MGYVALTLKLKANLLITRPLTIIPNKFANIICCYDALNTLAQMNAHYKMLKGYQQRRGNWTVNYTGTQSFITTLSYSLA